jgi:phosphoglycolate phosphatase-like HAD superfamily hydrolase
MLWKWVNSGLQVFILDLDGTLIPTAEIDNECFWEAVFTCFGESDNLPDLHNFKNVTDNGILNEWCLRELGRLPCEQETARIRQVFLQRLESVAIQQPEHFNPVPGVTQWLKAVNDNNFSIAAIATGGWEHSARFKLQLAGLDRFKLPLASSDDALTRPQIMQVAARKTLGHRSQTGVGFTYVGDGTWDLQASQKLGWEFIGIAKGERAKQLKKAGARHVRTDFCKT